MKLICSPESIVTMEDGIDIAVLPITSRTNLAVNMLSMEIDISTTLTVILAVTAALLLMGVEL